MPGLLIHADALLRTGTPSLPVSTVTRRAPLLLALIVLFGAAYGIAMGSYHVPGTHVRPLQMFYSALKVPLLLLVTFGLSLPSFFVINSLLGLRQDLGEALRALLATQACLTVILAAFAPITLFWYAGFVDYNAATLFNGLMFGTASISGQVLLRRLYRPLIARDSRHRGLLRLWLIIYCFVGIQLAWLLRPFIGQPDAPTHFFREDTWGNAYVIVAQRLWQLFHQ